MRLEPEFIFLPIHELGISDEAVFVPAFGLPEALFVQERPLLSPTSIHTDELALKRSERFQLRMNFGGQRRKVGIVSADDDSGVIGGLAVEADEVLAVVGEDGAGVFRGKTQDFIIGDARIRIAGVVGGQHVMPEAAQGFEHGQREVLVGIQTGGHVSSPFAAISRSISSRWERA